jgi:hypothetical protein
MNSSAGAVLIIFGLWGLTQVLAGQMLERLGVIGGTS